MPCQLEAGKDEVSVADTLLERFICESKNNSETLVLRNGWKNFLG
jgi:hypothetical protein